ncbi:MAG: alpha-1,4-glucan--maltose-1-phosphate maltosyltransferase [Actinomycetota bacterium]|nr:alpha-1,4-glucan--maltose-1-phosphate maltosyltransferase [Actinomycetota bacterium]
MTGRIVIEDLRPRTPTGRYPAKAVVGERVPVEAVIFKDGHDILAAQATLTPAQAGGQEGQRAVSVPIIQVDAGNDLWAGAVIPSIVGPHHIVVAAWTDRHATWAKRTKVKLAVGQDIDVEIAEGIALFSSRAGRDDPAVDAALAGLKEGSVTLALATPLSGPEGAPDLTASEPVGLWVDRPLALVSAWYELFPRSFGGFKGTEERVPAVAGMGFDVLYLPPIHPIGVTERKGPDNTLGASIDDPGSPWAIGSAEGGHTAIDPSLGTFDDFSHLLETTRDLGMEVALDYALQCSPDHPWVSEHPEWFHHRPDGSIAYAENPPKKYQDIYPINFWPEDDADRQALWDACKGILDFWVEKGVAVFRVDNPHTKPVAFWEWLIAAVQAVHPDVIFLAEAFTKPRMMAKLAEVGFSQNYTYFTWRTEQYGPEGLREYLEELAGAKADFMRPNFWPNTPDILSGPLRNGPPAAFAQRLVLAATMSPCWGMYSGYELYENEPASPSNEEYLHSEKYQLRTRDFDQPGTLIPLTTAVNAIRKKHRALQRLRGIQFHASDNPQILAYSKISDDGRDVMLIVVSLDPHWAQSSVLTLDLAALGLPSDRPYTAADELSGDFYQWFGPNPYVRLEPWGRVAHLLHLPDARPPVVGSSEAAEAAP